MMDQEIKKKWVAALRSGEYKQGPDHLKSNDGCNCCLGVLAEINGAPCQIKDERFSTKYSFGFPDPNFDDELIFNQTSVPDNYCGITAEERNHLIDMNDGCFVGEKGNRVYRTCTFNEIADYIEENL